MFKPKEDIQKQFEQDGVDTKKQMIFSWGAGITAWIEETAAVLAGASKTSIFDGSYQEYSKHGKPDFSNPNWEEK